MTVRSGTLYLGVFFIAAGAVTLGAGTGALDRSAVAGTLAALWPIAVIAVGAGLVLRRSRAALVAGVLAAAVPGLALGASFAAVPEISVPCAEAASPATTAPAETRAIAFGTTAADSFTGDLTANAGSLALCVPDQLALRVRSTAALGSIDVRGLVKRGGAWETPGYDAATNKADLAIEASVGSVTINPEGGCK